MPDIGRTRPYLLLVVTLAVATLIRWAIGSWISSEITFSVYYAAVVVMALYGNLASAVLAVLISVLLTNFLFSPPYGQFQLYGNHWAATALFVVTSSLIVSMGEQLRRSRDKLSEAEQHKQEFISMLGHELRNPLAAIVNAVEVMRMSSEPSADRFGDMLAIVDRQACQMRRLIDDLLDVTRLETGRMRVDRMPVDLAHVVRHDSESYRSKCEAAGIDLSVTASRPIWINADPERLTRIVDNLLENAVRLTSSGGHVEVTAQRERDHAVLTIKDTGAGIDRENLDKIFEPFAQFERPDSKDSGLGLGLYIVKRLVKKHGGTIRVNSTGVGCGAEFVLSFPLCGELPHNDETEAPTGRTGH